MVKYPFFYDWKINASVNEFKTHKCVSGFTKTSSVTQVCDCMDIDPMPYTPFKYDQTLQVRTSLWELRVA